MSEKSAIRRETIATPERDTLPSIDQQFLRDQLEALLSSHALRRGEAAPPDAPQGDAQQAESDINAYDRDTEPSADALLLRDAILAAGKSS